MRRKLIQKNNSRRTKGLTKYALFVVAGVLALSSIFMTVETATSSVEVSELRQKEEELLLDKRSLESSLMKSLSVNDLEVKGNELGYAKPTSMVYISDSQEAMARLP